MNAVFIIKDYHLLLLDYHLLGIIGLEFMGLKLLLAVLYWNYVGMECREMHGDCKGQQEHRQERHICTTTCLTAKGQPIKNLEKREKS